MALEQLAVAAPLERLAERIGDDGFFLADEVLPDTAIASLLAACSQANESPHARKQDGEVYALRNILKAVPEVYEFSLSAPIWQSIQSVLGAAARPVKAILFDKTEGVNWNIRWHQDNVISVMQRRDVDGFTGWSEKVGVPHVRPPVEILQQMLAARVHLDACPADNGALKVIRKSHAYGRLSDEQLQKWRSNGEQVVCAARRGQILFMRPLLLHCSSRAATPFHRRVLHIEYAGCDLPGGLEWGV
jgi:hypothetical protein